MCGDKLMSYSLFSNKEMKNRDDIRKLQDKLIAKSEELNFDENIQISEFIPKDITIAKLKLYIFPEYKNKMENILDLLNKK
jgi:hypothetical protein